jgi:HPt (histidine-containing phosphotransfer) domain-containing protein
MEHSERTIENNENPDSRSNKRPQPEHNRQQTWEKLTTEYLHDLLHQLDGIRDMLEAKDYAMIKRRSHRAKGTSATYRLNSISKNFAQLEILADNQNPDAITNTINEIIQLVELELNRASSQAASTDNSERNING